MMSLLHHSELITIGSATDHITGDLD
jgi:hypothetical protein